MNYHQRLLARGGGEEGGQRFSVCRNVAVGVFCIQIWRCFVHLISILVRPRPGCVLNGSGHEVKVMITMGYKKRKSNKPWSFCCFGKSIRNSPDLPMAPLGVQLSVKNDHVVMDNGICQVTLSNPDGIVTGIQYNGIDNLLENTNVGQTGGYWDLVWSPAGAPKSAGIFDVIRGTSFEVIVETEEQVEISFKRMWEHSLEGKLVPLNIDKRFIMLRGSSGFYSYGIYEHLQGWPAFNMGETRIAFKLSIDKFNYMAVSDVRQRFMPTARDRMPPRGRPLAYPEAVKLVDPAEPEFIGEVDDKYQYSCDNKDNKVHGWISMGTNPVVGFWQITPSDEFRSGGPLKQNLTSHVGPTTLAVFLSAHYAGEDLVPKIADGEPWKKVFGPVFIYLNSSMDGEDPFLLWRNAKEQMLIEVQSWPYSFPASQEFLKSNQRGNLSGKLLIKDAYLSHECIPATGAYVGLAPPGDAGSWQRECKDYQFWTTADAEGCFCISNVLPGDYNLFAWVPGFIGDYKCNDLVTITSACNINAGDLVFAPPRDGPTLWEIGFPDRSASGFFVPDPNPEYVNKLFVSDADSRFWQYGLWERYAELYPDTDLVFTVGQSDPASDWFFAQVTRRTNEGQYAGTTWQIRFEQGDVDKAGKYTLRVAIASATYAELQVRVNEPDAVRPLFSSGLIGRDNSIARHGIHGIHWLYSIDVPGSRLNEGGINTIFLTQPRCQGPFQGLLYDYIRLESPPTRTLG